MKRMYLAFLRGVSANTLSKLGTALVTASVLTFIIFELLQLAGLLISAYIGLVTYMVLPGLFVVGLVLIPIGWWRYVRTTGEPLKVLLTKQFDQDELAKGEYGSKLFRTVALLTGINLVFLAVVTTQMLVFMEKPSFCGTACHKVMNPEWTTYQQSPHAHVRCVDCHVGSGVEALIDSKLNGIWQIVAATLDIYPRPIPTPVHNLRPARETCEKCHWPAMFLGNRIQHYVHYEQDEANTPHHNTLMLKIGAGVRGLDRGSHWHVAKNNVVRYASVDDKREQIIWVDVKRGDGTTAHFENRALMIAEKDSAQYPRVMDCVDCHNRATHIYEMPEAAVDDRMQKGMIDRTLPYIKKLAFGALMNNYPNKEMAMKGIDNHIRNRYKRDYPDVLKNRAVDVDSAIAVVQAIWTRNIHPEMNITWGSYPNQLGHRDGRGCFRCHNPNMVDEEGNSIPMNCTLCHSILAFESKEPFKFLFKADEMRTSDMHEYLRQEFEKAFEQD